jgi:hypothetical protein
MLLGVTDVHKSSTHKPRIWNVYDEILQSKIHKLTLEEEKLFHCIQALR